MQINEKINKRPVCASPDHYFNLIVDGKCFSCGAVWGFGNALKRLAADDGRRFHDMGDYDEDHDDERTVDAVVGVGDERAQ